MLLSSGKTLRLDKNGLVNRLFPFRSDIAGRHRSRRGREPGRIGRLGGGFSVSMVP
jgi:hypothetical protein